MRFQIEAKFKPAGSQPEAIKKLVQGLKRGWPAQTLLGVTGSGKTFTMAKVIEAVNKPTIVISHNKTLAAQLYSEFKQFFPNNAVHYFVSYYDYYQPEAYLPQTDTYIEKEATINEEIDRLRHAATQALINRRDCLVVASVSCIYGIGEKEDYVSLGKTFFVGQKIKRQELLRQLVQIQYERNDINFARAQFRARGPVIDVHLATGEAVIRFLMAGNEIKSIIQFYLRAADRASFFKEKDGAKLPAITILPAKHYLSPADKRQKALQSIRAELRQRLAELKKQKKFIEAERLARKTNYDLEMIEQVGYCAGIENYSRHFSQRAPGEPPATLLDFFPADYLMFIDESHVTLPQIRGMYAGDQARKQTLVEFGFRLPSAFDNRPLKFQEFQKKINQVIYVSATPSPWEIKNSRQVVEQIIRPTGLLDPAVEVRPSQNQVADLIKEIKKRLAKKQRTLAIVLTKRTAEDLADYLNEQNIKVQYLHSEIDTLKRVDILADLRRGQYDVLVGINLLREGLDLPEVSLVAILDADIAGFLRNEISLLQIMGRAARHVEGKVIMYAETITPAMRAAIAETKRRRRQQIAYNKKHHIIPQTIKKKISQRPQDS